MAKQYTLGEYSRAFLDALDAFSQFRNAFLAALTKTYGEKQAEQLYDTHDEQFVEVERSIMMYLRVLFTEEMGTDAQEITI